MLILKILFYFMILLSVVMSFQVNLDLTEWTNVNENHADVQHDCFHVAFSMDATKYYNSDPSFKEKRDYHQIISLCMSEWFPKMYTQQNGLGRKFTFARLSELNITSHQLYLWSAAIDIIESYQLYLDQLPTLSETSSAAKVFYNCTLPRFGPQCQYSNLFTLNQYHSLQEHFHAYYHKTSTQPLRLSCYTHLQCNFGSPYICLDWNHICDGFIQCIDGIDEKDCWQMEINECKENEFRCKNGQCIPLKFLDDGLLASECLDQSDRYRIATNGQIFDETAELRIPIFMSEETMCFNELGFRQKIFLCNRRNHVVQLMISHKESGMFDRCLLAVQCYLKIYSIFGKNCRSVCQNDFLCREIIQKNCPDIFYMPSVPIVFGHIYLAFSKNYLLNNINSASTPEYICYDERFCGGFHPGQKVTRLNNTVCRLVSNLMNTHNAHVQSGDDMISKFIRLISINLARCNTIIRNDSIVCDNQTMYQCFNSFKCISKRRILDGYQDCDHGDDEHEQYQMLNNAICLNETSRTHFICPKTKKCISQMQRRNWMCECSYTDHDSILCADEHYKIQNIRELISFPTICDGFRDLNPLIIDGNTHTDETECDQWLCNNTYTRCNGYWDCQNGADEVDCYSMLSILNCSSHSHICISPHTNKFTCLSMDKGNDNHIDCLGATDEPQLCRNNNSEKYEVGFYCDTGTSDSSNCITREYLCPIILVNPCVNDEIRKVCDIPQTKQLFHDNRCEQEDSGVLTENDKILCNLFRFTPDSKIVHFSLGKVKSSVNKDIIRSKTLTRSVTTKANQLTNLPCLRGMRLMVTYDIDNNLHISTCLCPPNYYGHICQYQNQRVSLTIMFQTFSDSWKIPFIVLVSLIDDSDERIIHSYEQLTYLSVHNCHTKFDIYLLYSVRPKNESKQYSIHIDVYEKILLLYRGSLLIPVPFLFLPVQRIAVLLNIPHTSFDFKSCSIDKCINGECIRYFDNLNETTFCKCHSGYTGRYCTIKHNCTCSSDSLCIGISSNNRSICVCPINKWGRRCLIPDHICQSNDTCRNNGRCIPIDQNVVTTKKFECVCQDGFSGDRCEIPSYKIVLSFEEDLILPEIMLIHFIEAKKNNPPEKGSIYKKIPIDGNSINVYWSRSFHIIFVELFVYKYYLITIQEQFNSSVPIEKKVKLANYCPHIGEILNETLTKLHLIRRIKYFHVPCQNLSRKLSCFYDDKYLCFCMDFGYQRVANCLEFNHTLKRDCSGKSICENNGQCLQDSLTCPQTSMCVCPTCFYGSKCQFSTDGYSLSLDAILGYHIQPTATMIHQPIIVQISLTLTVLMSIIGFVNGILLLITFQNKMLWKSGCAIYLLGSSITTLFTMIIFFIKFIILLFSQMTFITDRSFLNFQCIITDYLLRIGLHMDQWLNACVALERAITAIKGISFNAKKSKTIAKFNFIILFIFIISTNMIDPIHRRLIDENNNDEKRIWCIISYPSSIQIINKIINIFHFCVPFLINLISTIIIIIKTTRLRSIAQTQQAYKKLLLQHFQQHKHLLISSILLIILAIPRLIITFAAGCMKTPADSWLFLIGYFISFMPPMLSFIIFVLPSNVYKKEFHNTMHRYRQNIIRTRFHFAS